MSALPLSFACGSYDRTRALRDGRVPVHGIDLNSMEIGPVELFWRQLRHLEFEIAEMSLSAHIMATANGTSPFVGLPVFPSRVFRRAYVFLHADAGITRPEDLAGKTIGVPEYHMTAALFIRGFLSDDHGVRAEQVQWVQGGQEVPGRLERIELNLPASISLRHEPDRGLDEMLVDGAIDALITASPPPSWLAGNPAVTRLFADPRAAEVEAYHRTGIFPIMHMVTVRRDVVERAPWVPGNLVTAFAQARDLAYQESRDHGASSNILPFYQLEHERTLREFGEDYWPYGVEANRATLEAAVRYSYEQGLSQRICDIEELFSPALLEKHRV
ncbi:hypothetical protein OG884_36905 [Streptosporangium sp. NBC_01755]|uniref:hypothetical protein n=1 Tax=Streptosporangium sp. NBC_01755 TaxID=2975949 RepID=UPI002DD86456|nr:hypothetical protein [Streptosporangium sp. NBC_01755]WSD00281.1 hypothetical protein OG884_36905 [Streptosporangium sp. NBC_01755]